MTREAPAQFSELVARDPLFAAEGLDLESASSALDDLEDAALALSRAFTYGWLRRRLFFLKYPLSKYALPIPFLRRFIESERARRTFLAQPTMVAGARLAHSWSESAAALITCVERYRKLHEILFAIEGAALAIEDNFGNTFTPGDVRSTLSRMEENARAIGADAKRRIALLRTGSAGATKSAGESDLPLTRDVFAMRPDAAPPERTRLVELEEQVIRSMSDILEKHGPIAYALPNFDGVPTTHRFYVYLLKHRPSGKKTLRIALADEYYFLDLRGRDGPSSGPIGKSIYKPVMDAGVPLWWQPATYFYTMRDQRYWADLLSIVEAHRRPELDRAPLASQKSSLFDLMLNTQAATIRSYRTIMRARARGGDFSYSGLYGLLMRSNPSICYLTFNRSVWRLREEPDFLGNSRSSRPMLKKTDEALIGLDAQTIERVMNSGLIRFHAWRNAEEDAGGKRTRP